MVSYNAEGAKASFSDVFVRMSQCGASGCMVCAIF